MGIKSWIVEKLNPSQPSIKNNDPGGSRTTKDPYTLSQAYREVEYVNRAVNMFVDSCAEVTFDVKDKYTGIVSFASGLRKDKLDKLLNVQPNPFMDISLFKRLIYMDFIMEGVAYIYWDGQGLYPLPACNMEVVMDSKQFINKFIFNGTDEYNPSQIIFIKDNAYYNNAVFTSGFSRLASALDSIKRLRKLDTFKEKFYENGAVLGLVIETDQLLSKRHKERYEEETKIRYNPSTGTSSVLVLDGGFKAKSVSNTSFKDMGTKEDQQDLRNNIAIAMGIPPILFDSGNNANIRPNLDLFFSMNIMPALGKFVSAFEFFFGYDIKLMTDDVMALAPDKKAQAEYVTSLVNNGIITGNEGRAELRYEEISDDENMSSIRIPQNIAGSGTGVTGQQGGKPPNKE